MTHCPGATAAPTRSVAIKLSPPVTMAPRTGVIYSAWLPSAPPGCRLRGRQACRPSTKKYFATATCRNFHAARTSAGTRTTIFTVLSRDITPSMRPDVLPLDGSRARRISCAFHPQPVHAPRGARSVLVAHSRIKTNSSFDFLVDTLKSCAVRSNWMEAVLS